MDDELRVLVVDDELGIRGLCREVLESAGCTVDEAPDLATARHKLEGDEYDLVLLDVRLPDGSGLDLFQKTRRRKPDLAVAIMTGHASVEDALDAVKAGALDYLSKPFDVERLKGIAELASRSRPQTKDGGRGATRFHGIVAASREMASICDLIERAAAGRSTVLIQGESGTGKELVARAIHEAGPNATQPFVPIDCGSIPANLLESELFGHKKGAFTGAHADSPGLFRAADKGTVFLDEIGELPAPLQAGLLRALQEREVRPVGATRPRPFHARVIVATNRDLRSAMADGEFRRDLFYRLHVIPIHLPPLRMRRADIEPLARHFLDQLNDAAGRNVRLSAGAINALRKLDWPGNVRQLQNSIERAFALTTTDLIDEEQFDGVDPIPEPPREGDRLEDYEKQAIVAALRKTDGNREKAAGLLNIGVATLFRKLKKYDIK